MEAAGERAVGTPNIARMRDYWLGGVHHGQADREFADHTAICAPHIPYLVRAQRDLLGRIVRYLLDQGVRQFLDLGSGVPAVNHVHDVAGAIEPGARVVYVDTDPGVVSASHELLAGHDNAVLVDTDLRRPELVFGAEGTRRLIDMSEPVAVLAIATLQHIPDSNDPAELIAAYMAQVAPGSYLAVSHYGPDDQLSAAYDMFDQMQLGQRPEVSLRDKTSLAIFFNGLEIVEPGIVPLVLWRPDPDDDLGRNPERAPVYAGVGRKP